MDHLCPRFLSSVLILVLVLGSTTRMHAQTELTFPSMDSLVLTADHYFISDTLPYLILLHEQGSSRGEFGSLALRFQKMNYNCLAVDIEVAIMPFFLLKARIIA